MDKISLLRTRKEAVLKAGQNIRSQISALCDDDSFVELSAFSFSKTFDGADALGEGVVTGFATIGGYHFYIIALNHDVSFGGLSKGNCEKIAKTLNAAEKNGTSVVYLLQSQGVRVGEGVDVLEGISTLLLKAMQLKGTVLQFAVLMGEVYGSAAALASVCDCVMFFKSSALSLASPLVLSAREKKNLKPAEVGGFDALKDALLPAVKIADMKDAASKILKFCDYLEMPVVDAQLNETLPALNRDAGAKALEAVFEDFLELGANSCQEVRTVLGRIGGIAVAAVVFDNVSLNAQNIRKIKNFAELACCHGIPFVTFVDCLGVERTLAANNSGVLKEIGEYLSMLDAIDTAKVAVVTGKAVGLGYSLFAAKSVGFDYTYALATAQISLFESEEGAQIELNGLGADAAKHYAEEIADPVHAAEGGYLDNIIEPQFLKQYLIASLQTLIK